MQQEIRFSDIHFLFPHICGKIAALWRPLYCVQYLRGSFDLTLLIKCCEKMRAFASKRNGDLKLCSVKYSGFFKSHAVDFLLFYAAVRFVAKILANFESRLTIF
jgi:hypothetical protein